MSNSAVKPRSRPQEITDEWSPCCREGDAQRMPLLRGTQSHLWRFPTYQSTPSEGMASGMRAVGYDRDPSGMATFGNCREREHQRTLGRHVIDDRELRVRADGGRERLDDLIRRAHWIWHLGGTDRRATFERGKRRGTSHAAVAEVRDEDLVAGLERTRAKDRVHAGGGVVDKHEVVAADADELADHICSLAEARAFATRLPHDDLAKLPQKVLARVALDLVADRPLRLEDRQRRHADGAVIQIGQAWFERPQWQ
jgi:hypothetical protein